MVLVMHDRKSWICALCMVVVTSTAWADTRYVKDVIYIQLRDQPADSASVIKTLPSGTELAIVGSDGPFVQVNLTSGEQGWVKERYLIEEPTAAQKLAKLEAQIASSDDVTAEFQAKLAALQQRLDETEKERKRLDSLAQRLTTENEKLNEVAKEPMKLSEQNTQLLADNTRLSTDLNQVQQQLDRLQGNDQKDWFLIGGGVAFGGLLLGLILPSLRFRRRSQWS